jgi:ABC-type uncharacterized transport system substrate-binding protein
MIYLAATAIIAAQATPAAERPDAVLKAFSDAVAAEDQAALGRLAPEFVMMVAPDFGVPGSSSEIMRTFRGCVFIAPQPATAVKGVAEASAVQTTLSCPSSAPAKGKQDVVFLIADGKVAAMYPLAVWKAYDKPQQR